MAIRSDDDTESVAQLIWRWVSGPEYHHGVAGKTGKQPHSRCQKCLARRSFPSLSRLFSSISLTVSRPKGLLVVRTAL